MFSLLALIAIILMDFLWPGASQFFTDHPATIGLVTFVITLIFTLSVVDRLIERRAEKNWQDIRGITLKGLNDEVRTTRDILWIALFGKPPFGAGKRTAAAVEKAGRSSIKWRKQASDDAGSRFSSLLNDGNWTPTAKEM